MRRLDPFSGLSEFMAVARHRSFRGAAAELRVTPAAVSQAVKALEVRLGLPLLVRTTRRVALSEAGAGFLARVGPAATEIGEALTEAAQMHNRPAGQLRLSVPRIALDLVILPVVPDFRRQYPDIKLEIDVSDESVDLIADGFDAGIRIGPFIERDMVAVRLTPEFNWSVYGSPDYFERRGIPAAPQDLVDHECIGYRFPTARKLYRWQFQDNQRAFSIDVPGAVVVNDHLTMVALAASGLGLAYTTELVARHHLSDQTLRSVLDQYSVRTDGLFLYFPAKSQRQPKLRAFLDFAARKLRALHG
jgi:DNA-binding transcriptional LysR family regulator